MTSTTIAPSVAVNDIGDADAFAAAVDETIKYFNDGDIVEGTIVKVDRDEVLLDIGYKTEGVIPSRELSIKHDVDPNEVVVRRGPRRGPRPPEGGQGRPADPVQEARPVRARLGHDREDQGRGRRRHRHRHRGRQGWAHPRHRPAWLPARLPRRDAPGPRPAAVRRQGDRGQDHRAGQEPQQRGAVPPGLARADAERGTPELPHAAAEGPDPLRRRLVHRQLRRLRGPGRRRRPGARLRAVLEAHRPPVRGRRGRPGGHRRGARRGHGPRARVAVAQGHPGRPVAAVRPYPPDRAGRARQGHQAGAVRCVRARRRGHRGPGPHLRAGRAPRGAAGAGRPGGRRHLRQGHRHRPGPSPYLAVAEAGERGRHRGRRRALRPGALRHGRDVRRGRQLHVPRRLRPRDGRLAAGPRGGARPVGAGVRRGARALGGPPGPGRGGPQGRRRRSGRERRGTVARTPPTPRRSPRAPSRPTRRCRRCATSSPEPDSRSREPPDRMRSGGSRVGCVALTRPR